MGTNPRPSNRVYPRRYCKDHERVKAPRAKWKSTFWAADTAEVLRPFGQKDRDEYGAALRSIKPASGTPIVNDRGCLPSTMPVCTQIARKDTRRLDYVSTRRVLQNTCRLLALGPPSPELHQFLLGHGYRTTTTTGAPSHPMDNRSAASLPLYMPPSGQCARTQPQTHCE